MTIFTLELNFTLGQSGSNMAAVVCELANNVLTFDVGSNGGLTFKQKVEFATKIGENFILKIMSKLFKKLKLIICISFSVLRPPINLVKLDNLKGRGYTIMS